MKGHSQSASSHRGFTLPELCVVLGVIALMAMTLLPALAGTKGNSKLAQCLANLRQIGAGCSMYADDFQDWYPVVSVGSVNSYPVSVNHLAGVYYTRYIYQSSDGDGEVMPGNYSPKDQNLGYLYAGGFVPDGHVFFCPGFSDLQPNSPNYPLTAAYYSSPQFMSTHVASSIRSGYMFNPRMKDAYAYGYGGDNIRRAYQKSSDVKSRDVFVIDYLASAGSARGVPFTPDYWQHWPYKGLSVGFTDGSAQFCTLGDSFFNLIVTRLTSDQSQTSAVEYDQLFNALRAASQ